jgi:hypothetical protein
MPEKARVLVVANRTACSDELLEALQAHAAEHPAAFTLVVPATPDALPRVAGPTPDQEEAARDKAEQNMENALRRLRDAGLEVQGKVGDPDPVAAAVDAVNFEDFEEIFVSTLPSSVSKWLRFDAPHRVERATGRSVTHVSASEAQA